jgi:O-antigen/teichoic acid export membrane protein
MHKVAGNTGWMMGDQIVRMGAGLVVGIWLARYLGPEQFGQFSYATAFAMVFTQVATLGLHDIMVRDFVRDPSGRDELLGTTFLLMAAGGVLAFLMALGCILLARPSDTLAHWLVGITAAGAVFQAFSGIECWFSSQLQAKFWVLPRSAAFLVTSLAKIVLLLTHAKLVAFAWAGLAEAVIGSLGLIAVCRGARLPLRSWSFRPVLAVRMLRESWPLMLAVLLTMVYQRIDQVMLGDMAGSRALGVYSAAVRVTEMWIFVPTAICASVFPSIVAAGAVDEELYYAQLQKLYNLMALIGYLVAVPVSLGAGWLVRTLYGPAYSDSGPLLAVLIWAGLFTSLGVAQALFMVSRNCTRVYFVCMLLGAVANVALNWFLIPRYGAMGAVIASCISYWFAVQGTCLLFKPLHRTGWMLLKAMLYPRVDFSESVRLVLKKAS